VPFRKAVPIAEAPEEENSAKKGSAGWEICNNICTLIYLFRCWNETRQTRITAQKLFPGCPSLCWYAVSTFPYPLSKTLQSVSLLWVNVFS